MATCHLHPEVIKTPFSSLNKRPKKIPASSVTCISTGGSCLAVVAVRGDVWPTIRRHCSFQDSTNQPPRLYVLSKDLMHVVPRLTRHACAPPVKSLPSPLYQRTSRTTGIGESVMHTQRTSLPCIYSAIYWGHTYCTCSIDMLSHLTSLSG